jgi:hypothetical protein
MPDIPESVRNHIADGKSVCPFAASPSIRKRLASLNDAGVQRQVQAALLEFDESDEKDLILSPSDTLPDHGTVDLYSKLVYKHFLLAAAMVGVPAQAKWLMDYEDNLDPVVTIPSAAVYLSRKGPTMFTFFSPYFDSRHPRYMPAPLGVLVPLEEFQKAEAVRPGISDGIGLLAIARVLCSMLDPRSTISAAEVVAEMPLWKPLVIEMEAVFDDREDPSFPHTDLQRLHDLSDMRAMVRNRGQAVFQQTEGVFRHRLEQARDVPLLKRMLREHPNLSMVDISHALFTNHAALYPKAEPHFTS